MTVRTVAAIASLSTVLASAACVSFQEIAVETPIQAKIDITSFQRVLVAGFISGGSNNIDPNTETARLLRSQLRGKQDLRVIDADALPLVEEVEHRAGQSAQGNTPADTKVTTPEQIAQYEKIFDDAEYWKALGAQYEQPLIVTGSVVFTELARSGEVPRPQSYTDAQGIERYRTVREFVDQKGYSLTPKFVFIDGRTGQQLYSETYHEETLYPATQNTPALSAYFEMMDKLLPSFLNTLSTQKIRGTRVLLK